MFALYGHIAGQTYGPSLNALRDADQIGPVLANHAIGLSLLAILCIVLAVYTIRSIQRMHQQHADQAQPCFFFLTLFVVSLASAASAGSVDISALDAPTFFLPDGAVKRFTASRRHGKWATR